MADIKVTVTPDENAWKQAWAKLEADANAAISRINSKFGGSSGGPSGSVNGGLPSNMSSGNGGSIAGAAFAAGAAANIIQQASTKNNYNNYVTSQMGTLGNMSFNDASNILDQHRKQPMSLGAAVIAAGRDMTGAIYAPAPAAKTFKNMSLGPNGTISSSMMTASAIASGAGGGSSGGHGGGGLNAVPGNGGSIPGGGDPVDIINKGLKTTAFILAVKYVDHLAKTAHEYNMDMIGAGQDTFKQGLASNRRSQSVFGSIPIVGNILNTLNGNFSEEENITQNMRYRDFSISQRLRGSTSQAGGLSADAAGFPITRLPGQLRSIEANRLTSNAKSESDRANAMMNAPALTGVGYNAGEHDLMNKYLTSDEQSASKSEAYGQARPNASGPEIDALYLRNMNMRIQAKAGNSFLRDISNMNTMSANQRNAAFTENNLNADLSQVNINARNLTNQFRPTAGSIENILGSLKANNNASFGELSKLTPGSPEFLAVMRNIGLNSQSAKADLSGQASSIYMNTLQGRGQQFDPTAQAVSANQDQSIETMNEKLQLLTDAMNKLIGYMQNRNPL